MRKLLVIVSLFIGYTELNAMLRSCLNSLSKNGLSTMSSFLVNRSQFYPMKQQNMSMHCASWVEMNNASRNAQATRDRVEAVYNSVARTEQNVEKLLASMDKQQEQIKKLEQALLKIKQRSKNFSATQGKK